MVTRDGEKPNVLKYLGSKTTSSVFLNILLDRCRRQALEIPLEKGDLSVYKQKQNLMCSKAEKNRKRNKRAWER